MSAEMTIQQIHDRFAGEWVLIVDPATDAKIEVLGGRVVHHSKDRDTTARGWCGTTMGMGGRIGTTFR